MLEGVVGKDDGVTVGIEKSEVAMIIKIGIDVDATVVLVNCWLQCVW